MYSSYYDSYYPTSSSTADIATLSAALSGVIMVVSLISLAIVVVQIIGLWKMFTKAGEPGWKAIIPIYNAVILFKISGLSPWLLLICLAGFIPIVGSIAIIVLNAVLSYKIAKSFGKDGGWAVGIYFLAPIFYMILGFGKAEYVGPGGEAATATESNQ